MRSAALRISRLVWLQLRRASSQPDARELATARPYSEVPGPTPMPLIGNTWRLLPVIGTYVNTCPVSFLIPCTSFCATLRDWPTAHGKAKLSVPWRQSSTGGKRAVRERAQATRYPSAVPSILSVSIV
jgi:hypothetical protein